MFLASLVTNLLVVNQSVEVKTVADVIALAKATPGGLDWASSGNGTVQHLSLEMFQLAPASSSTTSPIAAAARRSTT